MKGYGRPPDEDNGRLRYVVRNGVPMIAATQHREEGKPIPPVRIEFRCRIGMTDGTVHDIDLSDWEQECRVDDPELRPVAPDDDLFWGKRDPH